MEKYENKSTKQAGVELFQAHDNISLTFFYKVLILIGKVSKKNKNGWINPSGLAGWGQPRYKIQPKKILF